MDACGGGKRVIKYCKQLHGEEPLRYQQLYCSKCCPPLMEPKCSLHCSQDADIGPSSVARESYLYCAYELVYRFNQEYQNMLY
jgi:hypothetical protein